MELDIPKNLRQATPAKLASLYQWLMDHKNYNVNIARRKVILYCKMANLFLRYIGCDKRLIGIDVGCGSGTVAGHLAEHHQMFCVDHAEHPDLPKNIQFIKTQAWKIQLPDQSVDFAINMDLLEHLHEENVLPSIKEMVRLTRLWMFILTTTAPNTRSYGLNIQSLHITVKSQRWWKEQIEEAIDTSWKIVESIANPPQQKAGNKCVAQRTLWVLARS